MNHPEQPQKKSEVEKAIEQISYIRQQVAVMGFNDYEFPALNALIEKVRNGEIEPAHAVATAESIMRSKQDYH